MIQCKNLETHLSHNNLSSIFKLYVSVTIKAPIEGGKITGSPLHWAIPNAEATFWVSNRVSNRVYKITEKIGISDNIPAVLHMCALIYCNKLEKKSLNLMNYSFFWNKRAIRKPNTLSDDFQPIPCYPSKQISGNCSLTFGFRVIRNWKYPRKWWKLEETQGNPVPQGG